MTKKEIVSLSLKIAGIYCLIMSLSHLSFAGFSVVANLRYGVLHMLISVTPFVFLLLLGFYLLFSSKLPSRIATSMVQEEKVTSFTFQDIQVLAFSIIGVWLLSIAIPNLFQVIAQINILFFTNQRKDPGYIISYLIPNQIVGTVLKIALGIYLFSGGKGLVRLWQKNQSTRGIKDSD